MPGAAEILTEIEVPILQALHRHSEKQSLPLRLSILDKRQEEKQRHKVSGRARTRTQVSYSGPDPLTHFAPS